MKNLKSALDPAIVNFQYVLNSEELIPGSVESILPSTAALHWCMSAFWHKHDILEQSEISACYDGLITD